MSFLTLPPFRLTSCLLAMSLSLAACGGGDGGSASLENSNNSSGGDSASLGNSNSNSNGSSNNAVGSGGSNAGSDSSSVNSPAEIVPPPKEVPPSVTSTPMQVLVPAYFNPAPGWDAMTSSAKAHPDVKITAILNPQNGKFTNVNAAFTNAIASFKLAGGNVVGYVSTNYAKRSLAEVKANIDNYLLHYPEVSGFFLDEMEAKGKQLNFYSDVANYIRGKGLNLQIIGNPGTLPVEAFTSVGDTLVTFEGKEVDYRSFNPATLHSWVYDKPSTIQAALVHNADNCKLMQQALTTAALLRTHTSLIYVTELEFDYSTGIGNPWKSLPKYWTQLLDSVDAINKQQPLPAC